jgi:hypothetical protein
MNSRRILWGGLGAVGLFGVLGGAWILSLPLTPAHTAAPPIAKEEADAIDGCVRRRATCWLGRTGSGCIRAAQRCWAAALGTSERSLQRRLAAAGVSYRQLLDVARKEAAERYLSDARLSIAEIAYLLGYSEAAAFNRAFRRWRHERPQVFRQRQRRAP